MNLLVIVGPTASGKTELAIRAAKLLSGEVICADSRTVYKGLDIATAKPTLQERSKVPHHLLDIVSLDEDFNVAKFKDLAQKTIAEIQKRGKLPIMVGGSGLYIDSVIYDYQFAINGATRDIVNPRHLAKNTPKVKAELKQGTTIIGLDVQRSLLKQRISKRIDNMIESGLTDEVQTAFKNNPNSKALSAPGYKAFYEYTTGKLTLDEAKAEFIKNDYQLAKRQFTWFKRNRDIHWFENSDLAYNWLKLLIDK